MLSQAAVREAADLLWRHWNAGTRLEALPEEIRPRTRGEGYAVQALLEERSAVPPFGWKIAATSKEGQAHIGVDGPLAGRLLAERVVPDGGSLALGHSLMRVAEPELAFRMARDLEPRFEPYGVEEVLAAVGTLHPAIELPDSRFEDFVGAGAAQLIADNACAHHFVLGPAAPEGWRDLDLARHRVVARCTGQPDREGIGANVLGDPRVALTWLANELSGLGITLGAGQVITTGTCMAPLPVEPGQEVAADHGALGGVSVRLA
ncbi:hydratase [Geminicoccaceae bacterium 1502E]|nr:hydratase [Geminicoccaceae bacterium 1502E]